MFHESQQIGLYTLIRKLGEGGFGEVWLAENRNHSPTEKVAVKLPRRDQIDLQAVKDEIFNWILSGKHKNILPIIECETFGNQIAIISEFAPDGSLQDLINKNGALPLADAVEITIEILDGLTHLHNRKIIHRDLKPDNVLFQGKTPRLTDFGISRAMPVGSRSQTISGTLAYMAPEAFDGKRNEQTDIWAVGVILYQLLTGNQPFPQKELMQLLGALAREEPAALPNSVPAALQYIVKKSLAKDISERYQTADQMRSELNNFRTTHSDLFVSAPTEPFIPVSEEEKIPLTDFSPQNNSKTPDETETFSRPRPVPLKFKTGPNYFGIAASALLLLGIVSIIYYSNKKPPEKIDISIPQSSPTTTISPKANENTRLVPFRKGDKFGFSDENKKIIIEPKYDFVQMFNEGLAGVIINKKVGFIDKTGKEIVPLKYDAISEVNTFFVGGLALVSLYGKYGFINKEGIEITPIRYDEALFFREGFPAVKLKDKYGFIDKTGKEVVPPIYDQVQNFSEGLAEVKYGEKYGFVNEQGKEVIPIIYNFASAFSDGIAIVEKDKVRSIIDKTGKQLVQVKPELIAVRFSEGLAMTFSSGSEMNYGFIDKTGNISIPLKYNAVHHFVEGLAGVEINKKWGFVDKTGKEVIELKYDEVREFRESLVAVKLNEKWGFIDKSGRTIIPFNYDGVSGAFDFGLTRVRVKDKWFYIDRKGTEYYEP